jgi:putative acetyltransferase
MIIREEIDSDREAIYKVNTAAFPADDEAKLVDRLRDSGSDLVSLVAEENAIIVGHILFSPAQLEEYIELKLMGLAPMAVLPEFQNQGVGSKLVEAGLNRCRELEIGAVIVLGHPQFYPRFGFFPASTFNTRSAYDVADENFMAQELTPNYLANYQGKFDYHPAFSEM